MSNLNLTPIAAAIGGAASAESTARDKWVTAAKAANKAGVKVAMLKRGTEKEPNPEFDAGVFETLRQFIITGISAAKKAQKYDAVRPDATGDDTLKGAGHMWTMAQIVNLTKEQLRAIDDDKLRMMRRTYLQLIDGTMMGRLRQHLDRIENPDRERTPRSNAAAKPAADAPLLDRMAAMLTEFNANVLALKDQKGKALPSVIETQEAGLHLAALIGVMRKASAE